MFPNVKHDGATGRTFVVVIIILFNVDFIWINGRIADNSTWYVVSTFAHPRRVIQADINTIALLEKQ